MPGLERVPAFFCGQSGTLKSRKKPFLWNLLFGCINDSMDVTIQNLLSCVKEMRGEYLI